MKPSPQTLLVALLALTTVGASSLAWYQHRKLLELQAVAARNAAEREEWKQKFASVERTPLSQIAIAAPSDTEGEEPRTTEITPAEPGDRRGPQWAGGRGGRGNPMAVLMQDPEFARAMATQQKAALDLRYADLFRQLNLSPAQIDRLKDLLIERQSAAGDVMAAARAEGLDGREARDQLRDLVLSTQAQSEDAIRQLLGESGYESYRMYEQTQPQRTLVGQLETKLSYSDSPLQRAQMDQLVRILAETSPQSNRGNGPNNVFVGGRGMEGPGAIVAFSAVGGGSVSITDEAVSRAQGVLSQAQLTALKQMQAEQQAQRAMAEAIRNANRNNRGGGLAVQETAAPR